MLKFPVGFEDILKKRMADYPMNLLQVTRLTKEERERLTSDFWIVAEYLACKNDPEQWQAFLKNTKEIRHTEELLDVLWKLSSDDRYELLCNKIRENKQRKECWNMCKIADYLENRGVDTGIQAMIHENIDMGNDKDTILEKVMRYFSVSAEHTSNLYEQVVVE